VCLHNYPTRPASDLDADADARYGRAQVGLFVDEPQTRISGVLVALRAAHEHRRVTAPSARLAATPVVLRDRRYLDVVGKQRVVDALLVHGAQGTGQGVEKYTDASRSPEPFVRCSETTTWYGTFWS